MIRGMHHVAIIASDIDVARRFYVELLGGREIAAHYRSERQSWKVDVALPGGTQLELFTFPGAPPRPTRPEAMGLRHLALAVDNVDAAVARLDQFGVTHEPIRTDPYTGARFTFCQDPDGLPVEFYEVAR